MRILTLTFLLSLFINISSFSQVVWSIGPMVHVNFAKGEKPKVSYALECAYWNLNHFYYSVDAGIEFEKKKVRFYSELQTGIGIAGISCGPVFEINSVEHKKHLGFQYTIWGNYYLGFDYRRRYINKTKYNCLGTYFKLPFMSNGSGSSNGDDDWNDNHHSSGLDFDWD